MRRKVQAVLLGLLTSLVLHAPLQAEEADEIKARCEAEANDAGITDADEKAEYIRECIADLSQDQAGEPSKD
jgi:hypothetical protein